jgi:hypothetical protein
VWARAAQTTLDDVKARSSAFCRVLRLPDYAASFSMSISLAAIPQAPSHVVAF